MDDDAFNDLGYDDSEDVNLANYGNSRNSPVPDNDGELTSALIPKQSNSTRATKRGYELGDPCNPMDWHMRLEVDGNIAKRRKAEEIENAIARTTLRIMEMKKKRQNLTKPSDDGESSQENNGCINQSAKLLRYPPVTGMAWFGVSSADSLRRAYLKGRSSTTSSFLDEWKKRENRSESSRKFCALIEQVRMELDGRINPTDTQALLGSINEMPGTAHDDTLWIEKFNPKCFIDLVTEEEHNRCVLLWLRLWQEYVMHKKLNMNIFTEQESRLLESEEKHGRVLPKFKIMVLQGPSGIGKSTLACVAAKQAGYEPFVIGITELQSLAEFKSKIENVAELGAISKLYKGDTGKSRPACLVIDGIDYASADIIRCLTHWTLRDPRKVALRPIICTCNNLYTQNLKELRNSSMVVKMASCDKVRLMKRLQQIVRAEGLHVSDVRLKVLIELCRADVRLCLNTLQFFYSNFTGANARVSVLDDEELNVMKRNDAASDSSIFEALESIITLDFHLDRKGTIMDASKRCNRIQNLMSRRDDLDRFYQSLFHNFSEVIKLTNAQTRRATQYFVDSDLNYHTVYSSQNFALLKYQSYYAVAIHLCIAVHVSKRLKLNLSYTAINERTRESQDIIRSIRTSILRNSLLLRFSELVASVLPFLYYIIQPPIKGVNVQLFSAAELNMIARVVAIMCAFRMTYSLKYNNDGIFYTLEPAIEQVVMFSENKLGGFSTNIRKYIAHQITIASIKGADLPPPSVPSTPGPGGEAGIRPDPYALADWSKENRNQKQHQHLDDKISSTPLAVKRQKDQLGGFVFRYNQGSSQAIRRNIRIDTLFFK